MRKSESGSTSSLDSHFLPFHQAPKTSHSPHSQEPSYYVGDKEWFDVLYNRSMYKQIEGRAQAREGAAGKLSLVISEILD